MSTWENILWHIVAVILFVIIWFYLSKNTNIIVNHNAPKCACQCEMKGNEND